MSSTKVVHLLSIDIRLGIPNDIGANTFMTIESSTNNGILFVVEVQGVGSNDVAIDGAERIQILLFTLFPGLKN